MGVIVKLVVAALAVYGLLFLGAIYLQRRLIYYPDALRTAPADAGLPAVEEVLLETPDGETLVVWHARAAKGRPTLLYFHGNAGALEARNERIKKYQARGVGIFMMSYRGFSGGTGSPSEAANVADGKLAYDALVARGVPAREIVIYGESLGSGVAVQVAAEKPVAGVILDAPYTSILDLAVLHYPYLPARWFLIDRYDTMAVIGRVTAPMLIVHGEADTIIPVAMGRTVYAAKIGEKEIATFPGAEHSDHYKFGSYDVIFKWLAAVTAKAAQRAPGSAAP